jgi:hypothetical protein
VQVQWKDLSLSDKVGGAAYGATARPVEDVIKGLNSKLDPSNLPSVVWLLDVTDERTNRRIDNTIFQDESVGLALKRFHCFKVNVRNLPDGKLKKQYLKDLGFYFFDPAGKPDLRPLTGRSSTSLSSFSRSAQKEWDNSFTMRFRDYSRKMKDVLDGYDRIDQKKKVLVTKKEHLKSRPNPRLERDVKKAEAELADETKQVQETEHGIMTDCTLRSEFLPAAPGNETGKNG